MSPDPQLLDAIKQHFARKSSAQLQAILDANDQERWSLEAFAAAREELRDRAAGRVAEPLEGEEESTPTSMGHSVNSLAAIVGLNLLLAPAGFLLLPVNRTRVVDTIAQDQPIPFGPNIAWLALNSRDTDEVATALPLREATEATWAEGIAAAHQAAVFVTPPLGDWTLVVGTALFPRDRAELFVKPLLERLSQRFGDVQYFGTQRDAGLHLWARATKGRLRRGYGWRSDQGVVLWNEGSPTKGERYLELQAEVGATEENVLQLAGLWSIDPTTLNEHFKEPVQGRLGGAGWEVAGSGGNER